jgi:hypothetical protein
MLEAMVAVGIFSNLLQLRPFVQNVCRLLKMNLECERIGVRRNRCLHGLGA